MEAPTCAQKRRAVNKMCTSPDYAAYQAAKKAAAKAVDDAQQAQPYEDALIQQLKAGKNVTLPTLCSETQTPQGQESGAYLTLSPKRPTDKADMIANLTYDFKAAHPKTPPQVAIKKALKLQTIDDHF